MQRLVAAVVVGVAAVMCLAGGVVAADAAPAAGAGAALSSMSSLAFEQEVGLVDAQNAAAEANTPADWSAEDSFLSAFVEVSRHNTFRKRSSAMAKKFVADLQGALTSKYPKTGELAAAAKSGKPEFDKHFREQCKRVSPSHKMCKNFVTIQRLQFRGKNLFSKKHGNRQRFRAAVRDIILRYVRAWRAQHPKRSKRGNGNPWAKSVQQFRTVKVPGTKKGKDGKVRHHTKTIRLDVFHDTLVSTSVRGALTAFGRINSPPSKGEKTLGVKPKGDYPLGSALTDPHDPAKPYKAHKHVKFLREQVLDDLTYLREKLYTKISDKKLHRMLGDPERAPHAIRRTARLCKNLRSEHFFPPTFCRSLEYLASVHWVGRNFMRNLKDFSALMASFMDHNHKYTTRYGYRVNRKPNYRQDVTVVRTDVALKLRPNKFNLRTFAREWVNILSNVMSIPQNRIRVASVKFAGFKGKHHKGKKHRRHTQITFEFLPKKGDRRIRSRPHQLGSVDSLIEQFRSMALDRPKSPLYQVPMLSRVLPKTMILSKTLGRRPKKMRRFNLQSANVPRFAAAEQTLSSEVAISADEEVSADAGAEDAEAHEFEQADEEFMESDEALDAAEAESESEEAEAEESDLSDADAAEMEAASAIAKSVAQAEAHAEAELMATMEDSMAHAAAAIEHLDTADASDLASDADVGTTTEGEVVAEAEDESAAEEQQVAQDAGAETEAEAAEEAAAEAAGEVAFLQVDAQVTAKATAAEAAALHLDASETMTQREIEAEEDLEEAEDEADADEAEEALDEAEEEADDAAEASEGLTEEETLSDAEEVEGDAEWNAALMQASEQVVASTAADDEVESASEDADEADADSDAEEEVDDEFESEADSAAEALSSNAPMAPPEQFAPLPEVFADKEAEAAVKVAEHHAVAAKADAQHSVEAALSAVDSLEAADETTAFVEMSTVVQAQAQVQSTAALRSSSSRAAAPAIGLAVLSLLAVALNRLW